MLALYTDATPNGLRASVILEEAGLPYVLQRIDTERGAQRTPEFLQINPAGAIPVLVDDDGPGGQPLTLPQSGAIVLYIAEKCGRFVPQDPRRRALALQWFYQVGTDITSASSWIFNHATAMPTRLPENAQWLQARLANALRVADGWLAAHEYFADEVSIADFLLYPNFWFRRAAIEQSGDFPHLLRWGTQMAARPGVVRGMGVFG